MQKYEVGTRGVSAPVLNTKEEVDIGNLYTKFLTSNREYLFISICGYLQATLQFRSDASVINAAPSVPH